MPTRPPLLIADHLNSSDPDVHAALAAGDRAWLEARLREIENAGLDAVDLNAGTLLGGEPEVLEWMVEITRARTRLPIFLDSADPKVLLRVGRRPGVVWNSWPADHRPSGAEVEALLDTGAGLVLQLRRGRSLPRGAADRLEWAECALDRLDALGLSTGRPLFLDGVLLPWGEDLPAGRGLLEFVEEAAHRWPDCRTLVGLSNAGYGHPDPAQCCRRWWTALRARGLGAALLDPRDRRLLALARAGRSADGEADAAN